MICKKYNLKYGREMNIMDQVEVPEFEDFLRMPRNQTLKVIDSTRLMVEILWRSNSASAEFSSSEFSTKMLIDWNYSFVLRYRREKDNKYRPVCTMSFNKENCWNINIQQLQWSNDKNVSFRVNSSFNKEAFYLKFIEESFSKKWVYVSLNNHPDWLEAAPHQSKAINNYERLRNWINSLNVKYKLYKI